MIPLREARALALKAIRVRPPVEMALAAAHGRHLAEAVRAARPLPSFDNSAMDGYAVRSADTRGANRDRPARLRIAETVYAGGSPSTSLSPGEATRIFTGAPIPGGADSVVRQEAARQEGGEVLVFVESSPGSHIRRRGEEVAEGAQLLPAGQRLDAAALGALASVGMSQARVFPSPRVGLLTVGDELAIPGAAARTFQVYDCNAVLLAGLCAEAGASVSAASRAADDEEAVRTAIQTLAKGVDLVITSGGASVGDKDLLKRSLSKLGAEFLVDGVALKPGKAAGVALLGDCPVAILPGNPGAAAVGFDQFARPMLLKLQGVLERRRSVEAQLDSAQHKQGGLIYLLSAHL
ncbi:MAG TPA: gephyrin-like molybdotransferase Glp, partial [Myxococcaceae bacterium]|nr:gephyrin-like molybdotransferase Glp [Myxococcaceae bacterium]